ncbi:M10 family metallopeptidase [Erythrobacter sp. SD-21]|uniref:M10 family metallopeptidase n=1 Tax=Erythrobacter sp. SD-21 TaxID=161528 RepID=UPI000153EFBB|nr:M10 family metallopeptidase [Erythrobacter sp. SD-21]EDL48226.1 rhizobiocin/RTX toxin and hemolysin-type calcium binding protein [Erythrobacter sp. SD-21]
MANARYFDESGITNEYLRTLIYGTYYRGTILYYLSDDDATLDAYGNPTIGGWEATNSDDMFRLAIDRWSAVANITFQEASDPSENPDWTEYIVSGQNYGYGAYHYTPGGPGGAYNAYYVNTATNVEGGYGLYTFLHEIGHALGLNHTFETDGDGPFPGVSGSNDPGDNNLSTGLYSVMAYVFQNPDYASGYSNIGYAATPMAFDIAAIQAIYGANMTTATGDDVYYLPPSTGTQAFECIWDVSGTDTISAELSDGGTTIDLRAATLLNEVGGGGWLSYQDGSSGAGVVYGGYTIANGVVIENAVGSTYADTITGNDEANVLDGGSGDDTIFGLGGDDSIDGGAGADAMAGGTGDDTYYVDNAGDTVTELADEGTDHVVTTLATYALTGNVEDLSAGDDSSAYALSGNALDNVITGSANGDSLNGGDGDDILDGGAGADTMAGGAGNDTYRVDNASDFVTEQAGAGADEVITEVQSYMLSVHVENLTAGETVQAYLLTGNDENNVITGGSSNDLLVGLGGSDTLVGGAGDDSMLGGTGDDTYYVDDAGDTVSEDADAGTDTVHTGLGGYTLGANVENLVAYDSQESSYQGNELDNEITSYGSVDYGQADIYGLGGDDVIRFIAAESATNAYQVNGFGGIGEDTLHGASLVGVAISNYLSGGDNNDVIYGGTAAETINNLIGGSGDDTLVGGNGDDLLDGGTGADDMTGGAGNDTYRVDDANDTITELDGEGTDTVETTLATYTLGDHLEILTAGDNASAYVLTGNALANTITGSDNEDTIDGGEGADTMVGGLGDDTYYVDNRNDEIVEEDLGGTETVHVDNFGYTLADNVENLVAYDTQEASYYGNDLANEITAYTSDQWGYAGLLGYGGDDLLTLHAPETSITSHYGGYADGGSGDDIIYGLSAVGYSTRNTLYGGDDNDQIYGGASSETINEIYGDAGDDLLVGGAGADTLDGGTGADAMIAGAGDDYYTVDDALDFVTEEEGEGDDVIHAFVDYTLCANVEWGIAAEGVTLTGNELANSLYAEGIATLEGGDGDDEYYLDFSGVTVVEEADEGIDTVYVLFSYTLTANTEILVLDWTDSDGTVLTGNDLDNTIIGERDNDTLDGGAGADELIGGQGDDTYYLDNVGDIVTEYEGEGNDTIVTTITTVNLSDDGHVENLTAGDDSGDYALTGNSAVNVITGSANNDTLDGGAGADRLVGGLGDDTYHVDDANDVVSEGVDEGTDRVIATASQYALDANVENLEAVTDTAFTYEGNDLANDITVTGADEGEIFGHGGADTIEAYLGEAIGEVVIDGGEGDDTITVHDGDLELIIDGGAGADIMDASDTAAEATFYVDDESDVVIASSYAGEGLSGNTIRSTASTYVLGTGIQAYYLDGISAQSVTGTDGDESFYNIDGNDTVTGGRGNDYYSVTEDGFTIVEEDDGGYDMIAFGSVDFDYAMDANIEAVSYYGGGTVTGTANDDCISGGDDATLEGGLGDDYYQVQRNTVVFEEIGGGTDTVRVYFDYTLSDNLENLVNLGSSSGVVLTGNALANIIEGGAGGDTLHGMDGADTLFADQADEEAFEGSMDTLFGGFGNDILYAVIGNDSLYGGAGFDMLHSGAGDDLLDGGNGNDTANYANAVAGVTVDLLDAAAQDTIGAGVDTLASIEYLVGSAFADILTGSNDANQIYGGGAADTVYGGIGNDLLIGEEGNDTLYGQASWDTIRGDAGDDTLVGGNGGDALLGGTGLDTLWGDAGTDRLYGGNDADTLHGGDDNDLLFGQAGDDVVNGDGGDDLVQGNKGNDTLDGGADNDTVNGGAGNDTLFGGTGNDVLIGGWGVDTMTGGEGADTFSFTQSGHSGKFASVADTIIDFSSAEGDLIDLSAIDAISGGSDDAFTFIGDAAFSGTAGELRAYAGENGLIVVGDIDGDGAADFLIKVDNLTDLTVADFVL